MLKFCLIGKCFVILYDVYRQKTAAPEDATAMNR